MTPSSYESLVDRQIREAAERGEFDDLPGAGKPLPDLDQRYDAMWWVKDKMRRERLSYLPPTLQLRKDVEDALDAAAKAASDQEARRILEAVNVKIREAIRRPPEGPPLDLAPIDIDRRLAELR